MIAVTSKPVEKDSKMFRFKLRTALVALTAIAAFALPASALATNVTTWQIAQQMTLGRPVPTLHRTQAL